MHAVVDVGYRDGLATAACVQFENWDDESPVWVDTVRGPVPAPYVPGRLFKRELPALTKVLRRAGRRFDVIIVDGFVYLAGGRCGLGGWLARSLPYRCRVVGVAKNPLKGAGPHLPLWRGASRKPLWVSAANMPVEHAASLVRAMHGPHRIPTIVRIADRASRADGTGFSSSGRPTRGAGEPQAVY